MTTDPDNPPVLHRPAAYRPPSALRSRLRWALIHLENVVVVDVPYVLE